MLRTLGGFIPGDSQDNITMEALVQLILKAPPALVFELHKVATEISGADVPFCPAPTQQPQALQHQPNQQLHQQQQQNQQQQHQHQQQASQQQQQQQPSQQQLQHQQQNHQLQHHQLQQSQQLHQQPQHQQLHHQQHQQQQQPQQQQQHQQPQHQQPQHQQMHHQQLHHQQLQLQQSTHAFTHSGLIEQSRAPTPPSTPIDQDIASSHPTSFVGLLQGLAAGGVPEGFDLILAELASEAQKPRSPEPEATSVKESPIVENPEIFEASTSPEISEELDPNNLDETNVDELLAALAAAETQEPSDQTKENHMDISHQENIDQLHALLGMNDESMEMFDEQDLEHLINDCGIDINHVPETTNPVDQIVVATTEANTDNHTEIEDTPMSGTDSAPPQSESGEPALMEFTAEELEGMTMEQINELLGELGEGPNATTNRQNSVEDHTQTQNQATTQSAEPSQMATSFATTADPDTSGQYTPENVAAILKAIFEGIKLPANNFSTEPPRSAKRPSPTSYGAPAAKRHRGPSPNVPPQSAVNHLQGILQSNPGMLRPPTHAPVPSPAGSVFGTLGNSDAFNKRINAMKPPPYRPGGGGSGPNASSAPIPNPLGIGIPLPPKRKSGEDEKKIKAMGFPPLMAGIKRKAD